MAKWYETRGFQLTMLITGVAIWLFNAWRMIVGFARMDFLEAASAAMCFLILPPLLWRDWNKETK